MRIASLLSIAALVVGIATSTAEDKAKELKGAFVRDADGLNIKLVFKKDNVLQIVIDQAGVGCTLDTKYTSDKDGALKCEVTKFEKKGDFPISKEKGYKFSLKVEIKDGKLTLSDLSGDDIDEAGKKAFEGEYKSSSD